MADWLVEHAEKHLADPTRYANSIAHWLRFFRSERQAGRLTGPPTVSDIKKALVERFISLRQSEGASLYTISRDIAALRQPLNWAWKDERIESAPFVPDVKGKPEGKTLVYTPKQIAALLDAARAEPDREHIALLIIIALSTHGRIEAILELTTDQIQDGLIYFNAPGRAQTKKRRSIVTIAPTLAPWLADLPDGKVIQWKKPKRNRTTGKLEYELLPAGSVKRAFENCLLAAGISAVETDDLGEPVWLPARKKLGESKPRPKLVGLGSPNTLRHTCSTEMHRRGVPEAQIDTAAGHSGDSTNKKHYRHLRPDYLQDFIAGVESFWADVGQFTTAHLRSHSDPKIIPIGAAKASRSKKKS
ncbi:tyrosine-type recombinase/integrase [Sphingobium sp. SJ10-10]|uniref:tyrosine-type recombinase/integrase n=1 Tax=unclassified Sphingobium TaxID=2611147 RepID=UPI00146C7D37|nr:MULTISPECIES: tyrosine-type recombinase/integrase [unclassified Sphingobium]MEC6699251.1 tyrosine-type recombinase/integrase [Sphingobium sp. SJ10-10]NML88718.1 tyrosine-type recombinase/integrase [Sphingobium sp. TB-6]